LSVAAAKQVAEVKVDLAAGQEAVAVQVQAVADGAAQVRSDLATANETTAVTLANLTTTAVATHALVNSNFAAQLRLNAVVSRRLAEITKNDLDERAADLAEHLLREHEDKQAVVDAAAAAAAVPAKVTIVPAATPLHVVVEEAKK
jgi:hypothetical protein